MHVATLETRATAAQPVISTPSARKATVPVGVPRAVETVAVSVTDCPNPEPPAGLAVSAVVVVPAVTVWARALDVLAANDVAPEYTAVMLRAPRASVEMAQVAEPEVMGLARQPAMSTPSVRKVTVPVGVPPLEATAAVNVMELPRVLVVDGALRVVVVVAWLTVWARAADALGWKVAVPAYSAVMLCAPTARVAIAHEAVPPDKAIALQEAMTTTPSLNSTVPVGVPLPEPTVATKVTDWPKVVVVPAAESVVVVGVVPAGFTVYGRSAEVLVRYEALPP